MARIRSTAIILGYSFVKWLRKDLSLHFKPRATANFGLAADVIVIMHGVSGRTVWKLRQYNLAVDATLEPDIIVLKSELTTWSMGLLNFNGLEIDDLFQLF